MIGAGIAYSGDSSSGRKLKETINEKDSKNDNTEGEPPFYSRSTLCGRYCCRHFTKEDANSERINTMFKLERGGGRGEVGHECRPNLNKEKENDYGWERLILLTLQYYPN